MKKILIVSFIMLAASMLCAQSGLFDIAFDMPLTVVNKVLKEADFEFFDARANIAEYRSATNIYVSSILILANPQTESLAGWMVRYSPDNSAENDSYILDTLTKMYGDKNYYDTDTEQLIWFLTDVRSVHVMYGASEELLVLYYDSRYPGLFKKQ